MEVDAERMGSVCERLGIVRCNEWCTGGGRRFVDALHGGDDVFGSQSRRRDPRTTLLPREMTACLIDHALGESKNVEGLCAVKGWQRNAPVAVEWLGQDRWGGGEENDSGKKQQKASFHGDLLL